MSDKKAIFIGLGGAGVSTAGQLKAKLLFDWYGGQQDAMAKDCRFLFVDTDDKAVEDINKEFSNRIGDGRRFISNNERIDLGDINPAAIVWSAQNQRQDNQEKGKRLLSWVDEKGARQFKHEPLRKGASANRQQGRVAIWARWADIEVSLRSALSILQSIKDRQQYDAAPPAFYLLSGTCGGTGSSAFLDVAYRLDRLFRETYPMFGDPNLRGVLFMPYWYLEHYKKLKAAEVTIEDYHCNAFAFFEEMEAVLADKYIFGDGKKFCEMAVRKAQTEEPFPLFNFAFCIDSQTEKGFTLDQTEMYRNTAELLYYWHLGAGQNTVISAVDNERSAFANTARGEAVPAFNTIGYRALQFPEKLMDDYFETRFLYELFNSGVLGDEFQRALPDEQKREKHIGEVFKKNIARYLFLSDREQDVPNLEEARRETLESQRSSLTTYRFRREGKDEIDPDKVSDLDKLIEFEHDADALANQIIQDMTSDFLESGPTTMESIINLVKYGFKETTGKTGSLEDEIEDTILRYGLQYAHELVRRVDLICEGQVDYLRQQTDLRSLVEDRKRRLNELEAEISSARKKCVDIRKKDKGKALNELFAKLREKIEKEVEITIFNQQIEILNKLSKGEQGILDDYKRGVSQLAADARQWLEDNEGGLRQQYTSTLPKLFIQTREDVTTAYLPNVASFVHERGDWVDNHLFAQLYEHVMPRSNTPGYASQPLRYGNDFGYAKERKGLHRVLWDLLTSPEYTGSAQGYEVEGHTNFFRKGFSEKTPERSAVGLRNDLQEYAKKYISSEMRRRDEIQKERRKSLLERFKDLNSKEKEKVRNDFDPIGTQTFCPMEGDGTVYYVYAGSDEALATELGFERDATSQFVLENTRNRLVKIKVITRKTLQGYPHSRNLGAMYNRVKASRQETGTPFAPHIHKRFNEVGALQGLMMAALDSPEQQMHLFVLLLFYRELFDIALALEHEISLIERMIELNSNIVGTERRRHSPLIVESVPNGLTLVKACKKIETSGEDGRLRLLERNYVLCQNPLNFFDIFIDLERYGAQIFSAIAEFDQHFRRHCTPEWVLLLKDAKAQLMTKIGKGLSVTNVATRAFYENLNNILVQEYDRLLRHVSTSQERRQVFPPLTAGAGEALPI